MCGGTGWEITGYFASARTHGVTGGILTGYSSDGSTYSHWRYNRTAGIKEIRESKTIGWAYSASGPIKETAEKPCWYSYDDFQRVKLRKYHSNTQRKFFASNQWLILNSECLIQKSQYRFNSDSDSESDKVASLSSDTWLTVKCSYIMTPTAIRSLLKPHHPLQQKISFYALLRL